MPRALLADRAGRAALALVAFMVVLVLAGLVALWPSGDPISSTSLLGGAEDAQVVEVKREACDQGISEPGRRRAPCQLLTIELQSGVDRGERYKMPMPGTDASPKFEVGDDIRVFANVGATSGVAAGASGVAPYSFSDFRRTTPIGVLALVFGVLVVVLGRLKGLLALVGLGLSLMVVLNFIVPAILNGSAPLLVALVGSMAVLLATMVLTYGIGPTSVAASIGAAGSLLVIALLAVVMVDAAHITGFSDESATLLLSGQEGARLSLQGLVLAGIVIAALGVLDDVCVSQASTVLALRRADPGQSFARLFSEAMQVGRDHLSATVNTLVFAYVGAALPVLLIFETQQYSVGEAIGREQVGEEVVGMLVGSIGLMLALPVTTALAAVLARALPTDVLAAAGDHHHHHH